MKVELEFYDADKDPPKGDGDYLGLTENYLSIVTYWKNCPLGTNNPWRLGYDDSYPAYPEFWTYITIAKE